MKLVASMWQGQVLLFGTFWNFFLFLNHFDPLLVELVDAEREDMEGQLYLVLKLLGIGFNSVLT